MSHIQPNIHVTTPIIRGIYAANMTQAGTNPPTAQILQNTLGDIAWTYIDVGIYQGTLINGFTSTKDKMKFEASTGSAAGVHISLFWVSQNTIQFEYTYNGSYTNGFDTNIMIQITKYKE